MSDHERVAGMDCLFSGQGMKTVNVKFFRGSRDVISPDEFRKEVHSAIVQKRASPGEVSDVPPKSVRAKVDVRDFVANM